MAKTVERSDKRDKVLKAIRELSSADRIGLVGDAVESLSDQEREDLLDHLAIQEAKKHGGPGIPFAQHLAEREARKKSGCRPISTDYSVGTTGRGCKA